MPESVGSSVSIAISKPRHASVACNEVLSVRWLQPNPCEAGKVPNLKIAGLEMKQLKVIILLQTPLPTRSAQRVKFVSAVTSRRSPVLGFSKHRGRIRLRILSKPSGGGSTTSESDHGSLAQRCSSSIHPGVLAACHARK